ncbi:unnamed protein product [Orchesella dallaii]|uniref:Uncharacterized protein n=1 Tax=Orchesella dallaii TaxID=48710 RepID=A0ABP1PZU9_9HEXA
MAAQSHIWLPNKICFRDLISRYLGRKREASNKTKLGARRFRLILQKFTNHPIYPKEMSTKARKAFV